MARASTAPGEGTSRLRARGFLLQDLPQVVALEHAAFPDAPYPRELLLELSRKCGDLFFVATVSRRVAGYIVTQRTERGAEVVSLAVDPGQRNRGVGTLLMQLTIGRLRDSGVRELTLRVKESNRAAQLLYESLGFRRAGRVARYYEDSSAAIRMKLAL